MNTTRLSSLLFVVLMAMTACSGGPGTTPLAPAAGAPAAPAVTTPATVTPLPATNGHGKRRRPHSTVAAIQVGVAYEASPIQENATAAMIVTLTNGAPICDVPCHSIALTGVGFKIALPQIPGGQFVSSLAITNCPGAAPMASGGPTLVLANVTLAANAQCIIGVKMSSPTPGGYVLAMPGGTITSDQNVTNFNPNPNPTLVVEAPQAPSTSQNHLYVPVSSTNTVDVYATGLGGGAAPQYKIQSTAIVEPTIATVSPINGELYVYNAGNDTIAAFAAASPAATGTIVETAKAVRSLAYIANGMTVDRFGRLVVAQGKTNGTGPFGGFWYSDFGPMAPLVQVGFIPSTASQSWTTVTSDARYVYFGDTAGSTVEGFISSPSPPLPTQAPACTTNVAAITANPFQGSVEHDPFELGDGAGMLYYAIAHPDDAASTPFGHNYSYGDVVTTSGCSATPIGGYTSQPPGFGDGLTLTGGIAVDSITGTFAVATVPNYDSVADVSWIPDLESWTAGSGTLINVQPNGNPPAFQNSGAPKGNTLGQPSYGP